MIQCGRSFYHFRPAIACFYAIGTGTRKRGSRQLPPMANAKPRSDFLKTAPIDLPQDLSVKFAPIIGLRTYPLSRIAAS